MATKREYQSITKNCFEIVKSVNNTAKYMRNLADILDKGVIINGKGLDNMVIDGKNKNLSNQIVELKKIIGILSEVDDYCVKRISEIDAANNSSSNTKTTSNKTNETSNNYGFRHPGKDNVIADIR